LQIILNKNSDKTALATQTQIIINAFSPKKTIDAIVAGVSAIKTSRMIPVVLTFP
jgi:hypothetical protein